MNHTLRQKINEYAGKVPYIGNALTTEINGTGILAGALAAGMLYSSMARAEPYVDTRSALIKKEQGQVCLDTDKVQFHQNSTIHNNVFGEFSSRALAKVLLRRGYEASEGSLLLWRWRRDGKPDVVKESDEKVPHFIFDAFDKPNKYGIDFSVQDAEGKQVLLDQIVFPQGYRGTLFDAEKNKGLLENIIPPSCAALRDGRVKPSVPSEKIEMRYDLNQKECICPPVPVCEPKGEKKSERVQEQPRQYNSPSTRLEQKCFDIDTLPIFENEFPHRPQFLLNDTGRRFHAALMSYLTQEAGYDGVKFARGGEIAGPHLIVRHPAMPTTGFARYSFEIEARDGQTIVGSSLQKYRDATASAQFRNAGIPPRCPRKTTVKVK